MNQEEIIQQEIFCYIPLRVSDTKIWLRVMEAATFRAREIYFVKRYKSIGNKFGFNFAIILYGNVPQKIQDLVSILQICLLEDVPKPNMQKQITKKPATKVAAKSQEPRTIPIFDSDGKEMGYEKFIKIHCPEKELNPIINGGRGAKLTPASFGQ